MSFILSIETATSVCSVAVHDDNRILGKETLYIDKSHSGLLAPVIHSLLDHCGLALSDLDAVAVSEGPGSYTGLRIGVSTAKGLCFALDLPLIAVNTLEAMAYGVNKYNTHNALLCPMIDARRMEVYGLIMDSDLQLIEETSPWIIDEQFMKEKLAHKQMLLFGNGAFKCKSVVTSANAKVLDDVYPDASNVGALAIRKFEDQDFVDVAYFEPFYLKEFKMSKPKKR